ncbi:unnamed protein product [Toxocara canis]|uniref:Uncharacterized protein n=1 Tax=Toxocara canis TaxID=6265 RepID=A0A183UUR8_TOXCA|nr:unnamed protein product [Toxocara canis]
MTNDEGVTAKKLRVWNPALDESHEAPLEERREVVVTQPTKIIPQTVPPSSTHFNAPLNLLFQNYAQLAGPYIARLQADNFAACQPFMAPPRCPLPPPRVLPRKLITFSLLQIASVQTCS